MVLCAVEKPGCIDPENHESDGMGTQWFADFDPSAEDGGVYRTLVNGVMYTHEPVSES